MAQFTDKLMVAFFTATNGTPYTGLSPLIDIWEIDGSTQVVTGGAMTEVGGGFYKYNFASYDYTKHYGVRYDGGAGLGNRRYVVAFNSNFYQDVAFGNAEELITDHTTADTVGWTIGQLHKYQKNKTKIDLINYTLTVYDDDGTTPLKVFDLKDQSGSPSTTAIYERDPR